VSCRRLRASFRDMAALKLAACRAARRACCQYDTSNPVNNASTGRTVASLGIGQSATAKFSIRTSARWLTVQEPAPIVAITEGRVPRRLGGPDSSGFSPMARRRATKASGKTVSAAARALRTKAKDGKAVGTLAERLAVLERERDALKGELEQSKSRVRLLEETHAKVRDRLAWALDSLHNLLEGKG
jgi:hypothetical protein